MLWEIWPGVEVRTASPSKNVQLVPLLADRLQASYWKHCYAGCDRCLFWFPVAFLLSQHPNTVCVYAQLHTINVVLPEQELSGEISALPADWWERWTEPRGTVGGSAERWAATESNTHCQSPSTGQMMKAGQTPVDTKPNAQYAGGGMSRGGGQFVTQSLSPLSSGESLYLAAGASKR